VGSKKNPIWRVVVADQRSPRDGRFIETIGHYNPQTNPSTIVIDESRLEHWLSRGAQPSGTVRSLMRARSATPPPADEPAATGPTAAEEPAATAEESPAPSEEPATAAEEPPAATAEQLPTDAAPAEDSAG
jgi:small subunit ribosomal protein S16